MVRSERRPRERSSRDDKGGDEVAATSDYFKGQERETN